MASSTLTQERVRELFDYHDGQLIWRKPHGRWGRLPAGLVAGYQQTRYGKPSYRSAQVDGRTQYVHRLIWLWHHGVWPKNGQIDHIDRDPTNNRIENLRDVTAMENNWNLSAVPSYGDVRGRWKSAICAGYKQVYLGTFDTEAEAKAAYLGAKKLRDTLMS